jgi:hypothetical protein
MGLPPVTSAVLLAMLVKRGRLGGMSEMPQSATLSGIKREWYVCIELKVPFSINKKK